MKTLPCQDPSNVERVIKIAGNVEYNRGRHPVDVYTWGNCGSLYRHLKSVFHCASPRYHCNGHIMTKIGTNIYDIETSLDFERYKELHFEELVELNNKKWIDDMSWNFGHSKKHCLKYGVDRDREKKYMKETHDMIHANLDYVFDM